MRAVLFAIALTVAAACVVVGISTWSLGAAWIAAGVLLAVLSWAVLSDGDEVAVVEPVVDPAELSAGDA